MSPKYSSFQQKDNLEWLSHEADIKNELTADAEKEKGGEDIHD